MLLHRNTGFAALAGVSLDHRIALAACALSAALFSACSGGGANSNDPGAVPLGSVAQHPTSDADAPTFFIAEDPTVGDATQLLLVESHWGRLVEVYDVDGTSPVFSDFVIDDKIVGDGQNYALDRDPLTDTERLRILHPQDSPEFYNAVLGLETSLQPLLKKSIAASELPPFTAVPRNAALVLTFNDLLDHSTISAETIRVLTGYAPTTPFEARIYPDPSHGNLIGGQFHSTRVIVDFSVSEDDALGSGLPVNAIGLPASITASQPNVLLRIATRTDPVSQQLTILRAAGGRALSFNGNGPTDPIAPTLDVVRGFRSGGAPDLTGDPHNGFLLDTAPPVLIGRQNFDLLQTLDFTQGLEQQAVIRFHTADCAFKPQFGDLLEVQSVRLQVVQPPSSDPIGGIVGPFLVRPTCADCDPPVVVVNTTAPPAGAIRAPYRAPSVGAIPNYSACFVTFSPPPAIAPATGVDPTAVVSVLFSEAIDPASVRAIEGLGLLYDNNAPSTSSLYNSVIGSVAPSTDLRRFTFQPQTALRRVFPGGAADRYAVQLSSALIPIRDLAGNPLVETPPTATFTLGAAGALIDTAGVHLAFDTNDEDSDGAPEVRGQLFFDLNRGVLRPRAVSRFSAVADRSVTTVGAMVDLPTTNLQTPLSNNGSRLMSVWRYHDLAGLSLRDETTHNLDIESLWWRPFAGALQVDNFTNFQIGLAHSRFLPDEFLNPASLLPQFPTSGLSAVFASNLLDPTNDPLTVVHPRARGYSLNPSDVKTSTSGDVIAPYPLNRGLPVDQFTYWTWRDTSKIAVGGPSGAGADTARFSALVGAAASDKGFYPANRVPTIGLPLLSDIRCYPDTSASGQNAFRIAIAINSSARPFFRSFSTGGVPNGSSTATPVQPDSVTVASGGINPATGLATAAQDNTFYYGQADFLVRISRVHTAWFDTFASATVYSDAFVAASGGEVPDGAQIVLAYRGASGFNATPVAPFTYADASNLDAYGDIYTAAQLGVVKPGAGVQPLAPLFFPTATDNQWRSSSSAINGARFFQVRVSFLGNPISGLTPELDTLGVTFRH